MNSVKYERRYCREIETGGREGGVERGQESSVSKPLLALKCDSVLTLLISLHPSFSDPHLFSFFFFSFSSLACFTLSPLFFPSSLNLFFSSQKSSLLLVSCTQSIMCHKQVCECGSSFNSSCPHFILPLSQPPPSLLPLFSPPSFLVHTTPYAAVPQ